MKKIIIGVVILVVLAVSGIFAVENWLDKNLPSIINADSERSYDILFEKVNIRLFRGSIDFQNIMLVPLDSSLSTQVNGSVRRIRMSGVDMVDLVVNRQANIYELSLLEPSFRLIRNDDAGKASESSKAFQDLFGDIVSRGVIQNFVLEGGTAELFIKKDSLVRFGQFTDLNIHAEGLQTDSVTLMHAIPFQLENIHTSLKNLKINVSDHQEFQIGSMDFDFLGKEFDLLDLSLKFREDWKKVAKKMPHQIDMIEFDLKELKILNLNAASDIYGDWSLIAEKILLDSLIFHDGRDKNIPRPPDELKDKFEDMISAIPFPLELDTLELLNSQITYSEIPEGKSEPGSIHFRKLNAKVINVSSIDSLQTRDLIVDAKAMLNGVGDLAVKITIPYNTGKFKVHANLGTMKFEHLNQTIGPMAGVTVSEGNLKGMVLEMEADPHRSRNKFRFDYHDLALSLSEEGENGEKKKKGLLTRVANLAVQKENLPENRNYKTASYTTIRNRYRSPFNLMWLCVKDGIMEVVPTGVAKTFLPAPESKSYPPEKNK